MPIFVVDPGHGGSSVASASSPIGVVGPRGLREKDVTLALARRVVSLLGPSACLTRPDDRNLSLAERAGIARRRGADVFVSLHANEGPDGSRGAEAYVHERASSASWRLADSLQRELGRFGGRGRAVQSASMAVLTPELHHPRTATCLVEVDYLSDPDGERRLSDPAALDGLARAIARGAADAARYGARGLDEEAERMDVTQPEPQTMIDEDDDVEQLADRVPKVGKPASYKFRFKSNVTTPPVQAKANEVIAVNSRAYWEGTVGSAESYAVILVTPAGTVKLGTHPIGKESDTALLLAGPHKVTRGGTHRVKFMFDPPMESTVRLVVEAHVSLDPAGP